MVNNLGIELFLQKNKVMKNFTFILLIAAAAASSMPQRVLSCTGITLTAKDSSRIVARTIEWEGAIFTASTSSCHVVMSNIPMCRKQTGRE